MPTSEEFDRWVLRSTRDGYWVFDGRGRTVHANDQLGRILARTPEEMSGLSVFDTLDEGGKEQFLDHLARLSEDDAGADNLECSLLRGDGARIWALISHSPLLDDAGARRGWLHRVTELTERRLLLDKVSSSEHQLAEAQSIAKVGSWEWDVIDDVVTWSDELYRLFNLQPQQFEPTYAGFLAYVHPADRPAVEAAVGAAFIECDSFEFEARILRHVGGEIWTRGRGKVARDEQGAAVRMSGTTQDITDSVRAAEALAQTSARLEVLQTMTAAANEAEALVDAVGIAMVELARHTGWAAHAAYAVDESGGLRTLEGVTAVAGARGPAAPESWATQAVSDQDVAWGEEGDPSAGGRRGIAFPVVVDDVVTCVLEFATEGTPEPTPEVLGTIRQVAGQLGRVAERERSARELAAARDAAMQASSAKSDFLATMSHEIRTPMNGVIGLSGLLLNTELDERQRRFARGIYSAGDALLAIINDILDFSKIEAGKLELEAIDFDLVQVVEEAAELVGHEAQGKRLELLAYCAPEVPAGLRGDPSRIRQVLLNLLSNAVKFTQHGEVVVSAHLDDRTAGGVVVRFEVTDTGIGISETDRRGLFQPFSQADATTTRRFGGTGLGLAICRQLVTAMGGTLGVDSEAGRGSRFWFSLPLVLRPEETGASPGAPAAAPTPAGARVPAMPDLSKTIEPSDLPAAPTTGLGHVLVVEDNPVNQLVASGMLERLGYTCEVAGNGFEALAAVDRTRFVAVLMDCQMPEMDGYDATRAIRARGDGSRLVPVIAMTASATEGEREKCLAAGMNDFVSKPVHLSSLSGTLEQWALRQPAEAAAPAGAGTGRGEVLDRARLEMLATLSPGDTSLLDRLVASFLSAAPPALERIHQAVAQGSAHDLVQTAHWLAGSALTVGAPRLAAACEDLELLGHTRDLDLAPDAVTRLSYELDVAMSAIRAFQAAANA